MTHNPVRPEHLPDFTNPPLEEVVLSVQFTPPNAYHQILAGEVWGLFRAEYPVIQEQPRLPPTFEVFGLPQQNFSIAQSTLFPGVSHDRFWFLSDTGDQLIQFQQDRLIHNWRKVGDRQNKYPRFEAMSASFREEIGRLERYFNSLLPQKLVINQCEISYINEIAVGSSDEIKATDWLRFLDFNCDDPEDFNIAFRDVIYDADKNPCGRIICESSSGFRVDGKRVIMMSLTVRGKPNQPNVGSALEFIEMGRAKIVHRFSELTTDLAHEKWGRIR